MLDREHVKEVVLSYLMYQCGIFQEGQRKTMENSYEFV
jgi:hypothetical protein